MRLPMQGTRVRALVRDDPTCRGATKPIRHNYWACTLEPTSHNYWVCVPQLLKPMHLEPVLRNKEKPPQWETRAPQRRVAPAHRNKRKPKRSNENPTQPKINKFKKKKEYNARCHFPKILLVSYPIHGKSEASKQDISHGFWNNDFLLHES